MYIVIINLKINALMHYIYNLFHFQFPSWIRIQIRIQFADTDPGGENLMGK